MSSQNQHFLLFWLGTLGGLAAAFLLFLPSVRYGLVWDDATVLEPLRSFRQLKDFLYQRLYRHHRVNRTSVKSERIIKSIFEAYCQEPAILPPHILAQSETRSLKRVICDYIAGMTDRFAIQEYQRIFDPMTRA
jgi:dGTP triphosphohydrolase